MLSLPGRVYRTTARVAAYVIVNKISAHHDFDTHRQRRSEDVSTLNDVARLAGVSTMTVSRVINDSGYISPETRARVNRAIAELGYMPNVLARQLRSKRTKTLALVVTDIANPFFTTIARGVEDAARARGYAVMFCNTDESEVEEIEYVRVLIQRRVDGVLLVPATDSSGSLQLLRSTRCRSWSWIGTFAPRGR
jgi:LacI family transcriptional regulator